MSPLSDPCAFGAPGTSSAAGGAGGGAKGNEHMAVSGSPPQSKRVWIWGSLHSQGRGVILKAPLPTFAGTFGQGVKVRDPRWESRAPIQLGLDSALCQEEAGEEDNWL